jgi:KH domain
MPLLRTDAASTLSGRTPDVVPCTAAPVSRWCRPRVLEDVAHPDDNEMRALTRGAWCVQVNVLEFREQRQQGRKDYVACEIVCERSTHKGILLGKKGSAMKALATAARVEIEEFLGRAVYLDMTVKVDKDWRQDAARLKAFGY